MITFFGGCSSLYNMTSYSYRTNLKTVTIISAQAGTPIEIDDNLIGKTPVKTDFYQIEHWPYVDPPKKIKVIAYPTMGGHCLQEKWIDPFNIPSTIYFDTSLCQQNTIDINIQK